MSTNFKTTLETRRESMNQQHDRRAKFNGKSHLTQAANQDINIRSSVLMNDDLRAQRDENRFLFIFLFHNNEHFSMVPMGGFQGQMFEEQDQYLQERSSAMQQVESTIVELGDMFTQLATMVQGN